MNSWTFTRVFKLYAVGYWMRVSDLRRRSRELGIKREKLHRRHDSCAAKDLTASTMKSADQRWRRAPRYSG